MSSEGHAFFSTLRTSSPRAEQGGMRKGSSPRSVSRCSTTGALAFPASGLGVAEPDYLPFFACSYPPHPSFGGLTRRAKILVPPPGGSGLRTALPSRKRGGRWMGGSRAQSLCPLRHCVPSCPSCPRPTRGGSPIPPLTLLGGRLGEGFACVRSSTEMDERKPHWHSTAFGNTPRDRTEEF